MITLGSKSLQKIAHFLKKMFLFGFWCKIHRTVRSVWNTHSKNQKYEFCNKYKLIDLGSILVRFRKKNGKIGNWRISNWKLDFDYRYFSIYTDYTAKSIIVHARLA